MDSIWTGRARKAAEEPAAPTVTAVSPHFQSLYSCDAVSLGCVSFVRCEVPQKTFGCMTQSFDAQALYTIEGTPVHCSYDAVHNAAVMPRRWLPTLT